MGLAAQGGNVTGSIALAARPFRIEGIDVGEASIDAKLDQGEVKGRATVRDPRLPAQIDFDVHPGLGNAPLVLGFEGRARAPDLAAVPWLTAVGQGAANVHAKGELAAGRLDAHFDGSVSRFARDGVTLGRGQFTGSLREAKGQLVVDANLAGDEFQVGPLYAPRMQATTRGPLSHLAVSVTASGEGTSELRAQAVVLRTERGTRLDDVELLARREDVALSGKVKSIAVTEGGVTLAGVVIEGAGGPISGSLTLSPSSLRVRAAASDLDLKKFAAVVSPGAPVEGRLSVEIDAELAQGDRTRSEKGRVRLDLKDGAVMGLQGLSAHVEGDVAEHQFSGIADVALETLAELHVKTLGATLAGSALAASSWLGAAGQLQADAMVNLEQVRRAVPWGSVRSAISGERHAPT